MKKHIWLLGAVLLSGPAVAQQAYFGVGVGQSRVDVDTAGADRVDDTDTAFKGFLGASITPNVGAEVGLVRFGEFGAHYPTYDEHIDISGSSLYGALLGRLDAGAVTLFAKGGLAYWYVDYADRFTVGGTTYYASGDGNGVSPMLGLGAEVPVTDRVGVRFAFERFMDVGDGVDVSVPGVGSTELEGADVDVLTIAATYSF